MDGDFLVALILKLIGSIAGAILSLVFLPPKNRAEFTTRAVFSVLSGILFGDALRDYMHWLDTPRMNIAAAALLAMLSWFIMGTLIRLIGAWKGPPSDKNE